MGKKFKLEDIAYNLAYENNLVLLDGSVVDKQTAEMEAEKDNYYYGYLGKTALSSSSVKELYKSPKAYYNSINRVQRDSAALREGRLAHTLILEPELVEEKYEILDLSSRTTKLFKEKSDSSNKEVVLLKEYNSMMNLKRSINNSKEVSELFTGGLAEVPIVDQIAGIPFRAKADYIRGKNVNEIVDLKTTADLSNWEWTAKNKWHYDIQAYIYSKLFRASKFTFVVIEKGSGEILVAETSTEFIESGMFKVNKSIEKYIKYFINEEEDPKQYIRKTTL